MLVTAPVSEGGAGERAGRQESESPEGNLPEGRQIELDSETEPVGSCCPPAEQVTLASGCHGNTPQRHPSALRAAQSRAQSRCSSPGLKGLSSLSSVHHTLSRDFFFSFFF